MNNDAHYAARQEPPLPEKPASDHPFDPACFGGAPFDVRMPRRLMGPMVLNSPHSGARYPEDFLSSSRLNERSIRRSEDFLVDALIEQAAALGSPMLKANFPRAWLDVNREPYELDPKMFTGALPPYANVRSIRVAGGLGTIARIVSEHEEIYRRPMAVEEALGRIEAVYKPYHRTLRQLLTAQRARYGFAVLLDCHSMPSIVRGSNGRTRPDIVLGDRYGTSCAPELTDFAAAILSRLGYAVSRNKPYAGGFITEHYGQPPRGVHALQIELNRGLYMNERRLELSSGFLQLREDINILVAALMEAFADGFLAGPEAAE